MPNYQDYSDEGKETRKLDRREPSMSPELRKFVASDENVNEEQRRQYNVQQRDRDNTSARLPFGGWIPDHNGPSDTGGGSDYPTDKSYYGR